MRVLLILAVFFATSMIQPAQAASYKSLKAKGFSNGSLKRNRAGNLGWYFTNGSKKYFCRLDAAAFRYNKNTLILISSSGQEIKGDRKVWESYLGQSADVLPRYQDVKKGKIDHRVVGRCLIVR